MIPLILCARSKPSFCKKKLQNNETGLWVPSLKLWVFRVKPCALVTQPKESVRALPWVSHLVCACMGARGVGGFCPAIRIKMYLGHGPLQHLGNVPGFPHWDNPSAVAVDNLMSIIGFLHQHWEPIIPPEICAEVGTRKGWHLTFPKKFISRSNLLQINFRASNQRSLRRVEIQAVWRSGDQGIAVLERWLRVLNTAHREWLFEAGLLQAHGLLCGCEANQLHIFRAEIVFLPY